MTLSRIPLYLCSSIIGLALTLSAAGQDAPENGWKSSAALGVNITDGNSQTELYNLSLRSDGVNGPHRIGFGLEGNYGNNTVEEEDGSETETTTTQNAKALATYEYVMESQFTFQGDARIEHDDIALVDYRTMFSPSLGYRAIDKEGASLGFTVGPAWITEKVNDIEDDYWSLRVGERGEWQVSETAKAWQSIEFLPRMEDFDDNLVTAELGIEAAISGPASLRVVVQDKYNSRPSEGVKHNDLSIISALSWQL